MYKNSAWVYIELTIYFAIVYSYINLLIKEENKFDSRKAHNFRSAKTQISRENLSLFPDLTWYFSFIRLVC